MANLFPIVVIVILPLILTLTLNNDDNIEAPQEMDKKLMLNELRSRLGSKLKEEQMKPDFYLLRFLQAKKFDLEKAELMLRNHLQYHEDNNLEGVQEEDWSDMEKEYPYRVEGADKLGRPILQVDWGKWDIKKAAEQGQEARLLRYYNKMLDEITGKVMALQSKGKNVTQWICLDDMTDVNIGQHASIQSARFYYDAIYTLENNHPGMMSNLIMLNSPATFAPVVYMIRAATTVNLQTFSDPKDWKPFVDNLIDPDQLPLAYGGTKGVKQPTSHRGGFERREDGTWWFWKGYGPK